MDRKDIKDFKEKEKVSLKEKKKGLAMKISKGISYLGKK